MADLTVTQRERVIATAQTQLGVSEVPPFSEHTIYGKWYGADPNPWCAMFVSWCFHTSLEFSPFPATISKGFAYTPSGASWFVRNGQWRDRSVTPSRGWLVFFNFPGDGVDRISHVGIVLGPRDDGRVSTIEGNTMSGGGRDGGTVLVHNRSKVGIVGYGAIAYVDDGTRDAVPHLVATLKEGGSSNNPEHVRALQSRLNLLMGKLHTPSPPAPLKVDGEFGDRTEKAVVWAKHAINQFLVAFEHDPYFEEINGFVGPKTLGAFWYWSST